MKAIELVQLCTTMFDKEVWGGKLAGLARLNSHGFNVPPTWGIPTNHSKERGLVITARLPRTATYSVRSGAPVSMPGQMRTVHNVKLHSLQSAVELVWDSYESETCKAYREAKGIDDTGTAVAIQVTVPVKYSGVAFTSPPVMIPDTSQDPVVEYVEGLGDDLVGGTVTPKTMDSTFKYYKEVLSAVSKVKALMGDSDIEWAICESGKVWLLQHRPLKIIASEAMQKVGIQEILHKGVSIGAPGRLTGKVVPIPAMASGNILYMEDFPPDAFPYMMKARALLCKVAGKTCHAGIVAREFGLVAIGGVPDSVVGQTVVLDGLSGLVGVPNDNVIEIHTQTKATVTNNNPQLPSVESTTKLAGHLNRICPALLLAKTYLSVEERDMGLITNEQFSERIRDVAEVLSTYLWQAVICEARHSSNKVMGRHTTRALKLLGTLQKYGVLSDKVSLMSCGGSDRSFFVEHVKSPKDMETAIKAVRVVKLIHSLDWRGGSFGGPRWKRITQRLLDYLKGEVTDLLFIDGVFNLQHNTGTVFGKFKWFSSVCELNQLLDSKRAGNLEPLRKFVENNYGDVGAEVLNGETIFKEKKDKEKVSEAA